MAALIVEMGGWYGWGWRDGGRAVLRAGFVQLAWRRGSLVAELEACRDDLIAARDALARSRSSGEMRVQKGGDALLVDLERSLNAGQSVVVVVLGGPGRPPIYSSPGVDRDQLQKCMMELLDQWVAESRQAAERVVETFPNQEQPA